MRPHRRGPTNPGYPNNSLQTALFSSPPPPVPLLHSVFSRSSRIPTRFLLDQSARRGIVRGKDHARRRICAREWAKLASGRTGRGEGRRGGHGGYRGRHTCRRRRRRSEIRCCCAQITHTPALVERGRQGHRCHVRRLVLDSQQACRLRHVLGVLGLDGIGSALLAGRALLRLDHLARSGGAARGAPTRCGSDALHGLLEARESHSCGVAVGDIELCSHGRPIDLDPACQLFQLRL